MDIVGTVLSVAHTLFASLQCTEFKEMCSILGYESQLEDLQRIVSTVKAVLQDAETKEVLNHEAKLWIDELKDAVYDADDLLDKFVTMIQQKKLIKEGKASEKVRSFFSRYNPLGIAYKMSQGVKKIRKKLDAAAKTHAQFGFTINPQPIRQRREETCSYVYEANIIGREHDVEKIAGHLLNDSRKDVSFLAIVGIGGLGKTALAQLISNDARIKNAFPLIIWTCVSDYNQEKLDVEQILRQIVDSKDEGSSKESLQSEVREKIAGKKYLLVLDDVWTENRNQWLNLEEFLLGGQQGSWVLLTTRSHKTASIIGNGPIIHELDGLSEENSWCLFKKIAFGFEQSNPPEELVEIGQRVVKACACVPLAIRVAGSLLYGQDKSKWLSFEKIGLSKFQESQIDIMPILKLSYNQLESKLKNCFTYCALFPKDYRIDVPTLKRLWIAQGYVVPLDDSQSMEDVANEYFLILLRRCFFQDVNCNDCGFIRSCKVHDLMHDIAEEVAGKEICAPNFAISNAGKKARHIGYTSNELHKLSFSKTLLRTFFYVGPLLYSTDFLIDVTTLKALLSHWMCLRVLVLRYLGVKCLPESICELLHLRYLDISMNCNLKVLPKSLIKLYNLQTLLVGGCMELNELPKDFIKLVNLRTLVILKCGIKFLTCLGTLPQLKCLRLHSLYELEYIDEDKGEVGGSISACTPDGRLMIVQGLLSFPCLETLWLSDFRKLKKWGNSRMEIGDNSSSMTPMLLPQLKTVVIEDCKNMKCKLLLPKLEVLYLRRFNESGLEINRVSKKARNVKEEEYSSSSTTTASSSSSSSSCLCYGVPKLKKVYISNKVAWLKRMPVESFQCLETLWIEGDEEIESMGEVGEVFRSCSSSLLSLDIFNCNKLKRVISGGGLGYLSALQSLHIGYGKVLRLSEEEDEREGDGLIGIGLPPCPRFLHSLRRLSLQYLPKLVNLPNWMHYLSALQTLEIVDCQRLENMPDWIANIPSIDIS